MTVASYTLNFGFRKLLFDSRGWHLDEWANLDQLDGILSGIDSDVQFVPFTNVGGTGNDITLNCIPDFVHTAGNMISFVAQAANTGAVTLNCDGFAATALSRSDGTAMISGTLRAGTYVKAIYDGTQFVCIQPQVVDTPEFVTTNASLATPNVLADDFYVENNNNVGMSLLSPAGFVGRYAFGRPASTLAGEVRYDHVTDKLYLVAGTVAGVELNSTGDVVITRDLNVTRNLQQNGKNVSKMVLSSNTISGATNVVIPIPTGYRTIELELFDLIPSGASDLRMTFSVDSGATYLAAGYSSNYYIFNPAGGGAAATTYGHITGGNLGTTANVQQYFRTRINVPTSGAYGVAWSGEGVYATGVGINYFGNCATGGRPTHVKIAITAGTFSGGYILRGERDS